MLKINKILSDYNINIVGQYLKTNESIGMAKLGSNELLDVTVREAIVGMVSSIVYTLSLTSPNILFPALSHISAIKCASPPSLNPFMASNIYPGIEISFRSSISPF